MTREQHLRCVVVFGHVGQDNLGDEAAFRAVVEAARARNPDVRLVGVSVNPTATSRDFGIPVLPIWRDESAGNADGGGRQPTNNDRPVSGDIRTSGLDRLKALLKRIPGLRATVGLITDVAGAIRSLPGEFAFFRRGIKAMRGAELFVVAGSQHLNDYVLGPWNFPYTTLKWCAMARLAGARVALLNVGAGPLRTWLGRSFVRATLAMSSHSSFRDSSSIDCVRDIGVSVAGPPLPDLVFSLTLGDERRVAAPDGGRPVVGINPIPYSDPRYWVGGGEQQYWRYLGVLADFTAWLCERGYEVRHFPTQLTLDPVVIRDLKSLVSEELIASGRVTSVQISSVDDLVAAIADMHAVVASRFHGLVFAAARSKPVIGIAYAAKTCDLLGYLGVGDMAIEIEKLDLESLLQRFERIEVRRDQMIDELAGRVEIAKAQLESQFDAIFGVRAAKPPTDRFEIRGRNEYQ